MKVRIGCEKEKPYFLDRASKYIRVMPSDFMFPQLLPLIAPSFIESSGLGMIRSVLILSKEPRPVHSGHAPYGLLNENMRGCMSSMDIPQSSQA